MTENFNAVDGCIYVKVSDDEEDESRSDTMMMILIGIEYERKLYLCVLLCINIQPNIYSTKKYIKEETKSGNLYDLA